MTLKELREKVRQLERLTTPSGRGSFLALYGAQAPKGRAANDARYQPGPETDVPF
jgi:hypothetical protein